jgi:hypothetical protein
MAMTTEERDVLTQTVDSLQALGIVVSTLLAVLNDEIPKLRENALNRLATASVRSGSGPATTGIDRQRLFAMAAQFIASLEPPDRS